MAERDRLVNLVKNATPTEALGALRQDMERDSRVFRQCHALAHEVGRAAYGKLKSFSGAVLYQDDICGSGYLHGIIETYFTQLSDIRTTMKTLCAPLNGKCFHGVGHGLMYASQNDLPGSITLCNTYKLSSQKVQCAEGVFMENFGADAVDHPSAYLRPDDMFFPCRTQHDPFTAVCYFYAPRYFISIHPDAFDDAFTTCEKVDKQYRFACVKGVGSTAMKYTMQDPASVEQLCMRHGPVLETPCIEGMVSYYMVNFASTQKALTLCNQLSAAHQLLCRAVVRDSRDFFTD